MNFQYLRAARGNKAMHTGCGPMYGIGFDDHTLFDEFFVHLFYLLCLCIWLLVVNVEFSL